MFLQVFVSKTVKIFFSFYKTFNLHIFYNVCFQSENGNKTHPCSLSPCGPNSQCREINRQAVCACLPEFLGQPPGCRPECTINSECSSTKACINRKCTNPCPGTCGLNAQCETINHRPICSCQAGYTGDPFSNCLPSPSKFYYFSTYYSIFQFNMLTSNNYVMISEDLK